MNDREIVELTPCHMLHAIRLLVLKLRRRSEGERLVKPVTKMYYRVGGVSCVFAGLPMRAAVSTPGAARDGGQLPQPPIGPWNGMEQGN